MSAGQEHTAETGHASGHDHVRSSSKRLLAATFLNLAITAAEIAGGLLSNSLSLLSDALHNLGDGIAVFIAFVAHKVSKRGSSPSRTFGYKRVEILAAFINSVVLVVICIFLIYEAVLRFSHPAPIKGLIMFVVAAAGLLGNLAGVLILHSASPGNINIRAAYLHLLGDTLSSVVVILGGILIWFFNAAWIDPLVTILISAYILRETYRLLRESIDILMQATPRNLRLDLIKKEIEKFPEVLNIHHIHAWNLNDREIHFEGHLDLREDLRTSNTEVVRGRIEKMLREKFDIAHTTIQVEYGCCDDKEMIHELHGEG